MIYQTLYESCGSIDVVYQFLQQKEGMQTFFWLPEEKDLHPIQKAVCCLRYNNISYDNISSLLHIKSHNTIVSIIRLTAGSRKWEPGREGGRYSLVSDILIEKLKNKIIFSRRGLNCMKTIEAKAMINDLIDKTKKED